MTLAICISCSKSVDRWRDAAHTKPASLCKECHAAYMRRTRPKHVELSPDQKRRANARAYANVYQRRGKLIPLRCERCGDPNTVKHHPDYSKPLEVIWLCRPCLRDLIQAKDPQSALPAQ